MNSLPALKCRKRPRQTQGFILDAQTLQGKRGSAHLKGWVNSLPAQARQSARCLKRMCTRWRKDASEDASAACPQGYEQTLHGTCAVRNAASMDGLARTTTPVIHATDTSLQSSPCLAFILHVASLKPSCHLGQRLKIMQSTAREDQG